MLYIKKKYSFIIYMAQNNIVINCGDCNDCGVSVNENKYNALNKALITNPLVKVPFSYFDLGQDLKRLIDYGFNDNARRVYLQYQVAGFSVPARADYLANLLENAAVVLGLPNKNAGWKFRLTLVRTDGACLYDSVEAAKNIRVSNVGSAVTLSLPTSQYVDTKANLVAGAPNGVTSVALGNLATTSRGLGVFTTTGTAVAGAAVIDGVNGSLFCDNLGSYKEIQEANLEKIGTTLRTTSVGGVTKYGYYVAGTVDLTSPENNNTGSSWVVRMAYYQA